MTEMTEMCAGVSDAKIRETWEVLETPFYALPAGRVNKKILQVVLLNKWQFSHKRATQV